MAPSGPEMQNPPHTQNKRPLRVKAAVFSIDLLEVPPEETISNRDPVQILFIDGGLQR